ncbi:hypothetical protein DEU56DRAFT_729816 [Suillus clintonianus]|uniref:uncharacterized protein n=1 Tax=Suillus clintonianus TaxID=1904413 RepID=UPI001B883035|nr:uncharacterized protein DEU56DRAFT_729816 [Suillus clintonianus]KAG2148895.1 hypothetical protein DEU56DRAFT_729816 [Suillus clintonianus]
MAFQQFGKGALRVAKNYVKSYSDTQAKVREATSNDPSGPSGTLMNEIAQMSYNQNDFVEIMEMLDKRLNDKGKNWRHVFKSLTVLDYLLHVGSENVVLYFRDNLWIIKTLEEFQYVDEDRKDCGSNVRQKAKHILNLLSDPARLQEERRTRASMRDPMIKGQANRGPDRDEDELRKAIEASKKTLAEEPEENDLATAIRLSESRYPQQFMTAEGGVSEEEEATRHKAVKDSHVDSLFDDRAQTQVTTDNLVHPRSLSTGSNNNNPFPFIDHTSYATGLLPQAQGAPRVAKKYTKGYLDTQAKVLEATSNDPTGPSGTQMSEIAKLSYNQCVIVRQLAWWSWFISSADAPLFTGKTLTRSWKCLIKG